MGDNAHGAGLVHEVEHPAGSRYVISCQCGEWESTPESSVDEAFELYNAHVIACLARWN